MAAVLLLAGCAGGPAQRGTDAEPAALDAAAVCPGGTAEQGVVVCARLQPSGDPLVLPPDGGAVRYGALEQGGERLLTRAGALALTPEVVQQLQDRLEADRSAVAGASTGAAEDGDVASRTGPYAQLVYRAEVEGGSATSLTPVVRVDESALMTHAFGGRVLEGEIGTFLSEDEGYDLEETLPVRVELADAADDAVVTGRIVNATRPVRTSTGTCAPALRAAGARDPLQDPFTDAVTLQRFPSMHGPFDDELLLKWDADVSNMGRELYPSAATLLGLDPLDETWETSLHGNPAAGPTLTLRLVEGGGGAC